VGTIDARAATAAVLLFIVAAMWLFVLGLVGWLGVPRWQLVVLSATQAAWIIGAGLLAGWRWARKGALLYAMFGLALGVWSAWVGMSAEYGTYDAVEWVFTAVVGSVAILIGGLVLRPFAR
jgi:hypothetical protein